MTPQVCQLCGLRFAKPCTNYVQVAQCSVWRRPECKSSRELLTSHIITTMTSAESLTGKRSDRLGFGVLSTKQRKGMIIRMTRIRTLEDKLKKLGYFSELITSFDRVMSGDKLTTSSTGPNPTVTSSLCSTTKTKAVQ